MLVPAFTVALGCKLTVIVVVAGTVHPDGGNAVNVNNANPLAISVADGVKIGVSVVAFVNVPRVPPVVSVHKIEVLLFMVTKSGKVNVSPHIVMAFVVVVMLGF
jgi:hypothetical protein